MVPDEENSILCIQARTIPLWTKKKVVIFQVTKIFLLSNRTLEREGQVLRYGLKIKLSAGSTVTVTEY